MTPNDAVTFISDLLEEPLNRVRHTARLLRQTDSGMWPSVGRGHRASELLTPHHIACLLGVLAMDRSSTEWAATLAGEGWFAGEIHEVTEALLGNCLCNCRFRFVSRGLLHEVTFPAYLLGQLRERLS